QDMALLLAQGRHDGQHPFDKVTALAALSAKAALAPEHDGTQGALRGVVGGVYALFVHKGPQRWLVLQERAAEGGTLGVVTQRPFPQEGVDLPPELCDIDAEGGALQGAIAYPVPP